MKNDFGRFFTLNSGHILIYRAEESLAEEYNNQLSKLIDVDKMSKLTVQRNEGDYIRLKDGSLLFYGGFEKCEIYTECEPINIVELKSFANN